MRGTTQESNRKGRSIHRSLNLFPAYPIFHQSLANKSKLEEICDRIHWRALGMWPDER